MALKNAIKTRPRRLQYSESEEDIDDDMHVEGERNSIANQANVIEEMEMSPPATPTHVMSPLLGTDEIIDFSPINSSHGAYSNLYQMIDISPRHSAEEEMFEVRH